MPKTYRPEYERVEEKAFISSYDKSVVKTRTLKLNGDGRTITFREAHQRAESNLTGFMRWMSRARKLTVMEWEEDDLRRIVDDLVMYTEIWQREIEKLHGKQTKQQKIASLRNIAGRSEGEAALYLAKADELEEELRKENDNDARRRY